MTTRALSATATAIRDLVGNPNWNAQNWATEHSVTLALIWPAVLTVIFPPLAVRQYRALDR